MLTVSAPLARSEIPLSAHSPVLVSAQGPFRTQSNFHIRSWTSFLFLFCLFPPSFSYCVSSAKWFIGLWFCGSGTAFLPQRLETKDRLQPGQVQFLPVSASPYWVMSMHKIFHLSYNFAVGCDCLVVVIKLSPIALVVDPT